MQPPHERAGIAPTNALEAFPESADSPATASAPASGGDTHPVVVRIAGDLDGTAPRFTLHHGSETVPLEPGKAWAQIDHFKWVTRGLIEPPQSFLVHPDHSVDLNGEHFSPTSPEGAAAFEELLNRRHATPTAATTRTVTPTTQAGPARTLFHVRLDPLGHFLVEARRRDERTETGLRGLLHLAADGWMLRPNQVHVDPLQRYLELDGTRIECTAAGAEQLTTLLNERYRPPEDSGTPPAIEVRENPAASTGFDIHFWISRAGTRFEIKGHLSQDKLDLLQDHDRCDLLLPGIILRLAPPFLYLRRRRADGGEEPIPGLPDVKYRGITAPDLQALLNHPLLRGGSATDSVPKPTTPTTTLTEAAPRPATPSPPPPAMPAATAPPPVPITPVPITPVPITPVPTAPVPPPVPTPPEAPAPAPVSETPPDPQAVNEGVFYALARELGLTVQDVLLSLPLVFENRRFQILAFDGAEIGSVLELRGGDFYGFYLTHLGSNRIDLVYACDGVHLEWGTHKCAIQPGSGAETLEFHGPALLGLGQDADHNFLFLVTQPYHEWIQPHVKTCAAARARFLTLGQWSRSQESHVLIWPPEADSAPPQAVTTAP